MSSAKPEKQLSYSEIAGFCTQMAMVLNAGISTYEGVSALLESESDKETRDILNIIFDELENGTSFYEALKTTGVFPKYVLNMIGIGEQTGKLEDVLNSLASYCEREDSIRKGIKSAVLYPLLMIAMMLAVIIVLVVKVLPLFSQIYEELGTGLTGMALVLMNFCTAFNDHILIIVAAAVIIIAFLLLFFFRSKKGKLLLLKNDLNMQVAASRFANCMALALSSGLDTEQGMDLAIELVDNPFMCDRIKQCKADIASGTSFDHAIVASGIFSGIYKSMILIGYKTGSMDKIMQKIAAEYDEMADEKISRKISRLEPTLVIILSVVIGMLLLSFLLPLLGIMSNIG